MGLFLFRVSRGSAARRLARRAGTSPADLAECLERHWGRRRPRLRRGARERRAAKMSPQKIGRRTDEDRNVFAPKKAPTGHEARVRRPHKFSPQMTQISADFLKPRMDADAHGSFGGRAFPLARRGLEKKKSAFIRGLKNLCAATGRKSYVRSGDVKPCRLCSRGSPSGER